MLRCTLTCMQHPNPSSCVLCPSSGHCPRPDACTNWPAYSDDPFLVDQILRNYESMRGMLQRCVHDGANSPIWTSLLGTAILASLTLKLKACIYMSTPDHLAPQHLNGDAGQRGAYRLLEAH